MEEKLSEDHAEKRKHFAAELGSSSQGNLLCVFQIPEGDTRPRDRHEATGSKCDDTRQHRQQATAAGFARPMPTTRLTTDPQKQKKTHFWTCEETAHVVAECHRRKPPWSRPTRTGADVLCLTRGVQATVATAALRLPLPSHGDPATQPGGLLHACNAGGTILPGTSGSATPKPPARRTERRPGPSEKPSSTCFPYTSSQRVLTGQDRLRVPEASRGASASRAGRGDLHL